MGGGLVCLQIEYIARRCHAPLSLFPFLTELRVVEDCCCRAETTGHVDYIYRRNSGRSRAKQSFNGEGIGSPRLLRIYGSVQDFVAHGYEV